MTNTSEIAVPVEASLLAMDVNDDAWCLEKCVEFEFIASRLAATAFAKKNRRLREQSTATAR